MENPTTFSTELGAEIILRPEFVDSMNTTSQAANFTITDNFIFFVKLTLI